MFKKIFFVFLTFLGWMLSPFTWWNDAFVNLPLAYILGSVLNRLLPSAFLSAFLVSYWFTNILGVFLMYIGSGGLSAKGPIKNKAYVILITIIIYSIISAFLIKFKIVRPF